MSVPDILPKLKTLTLVLFSLVWNVDNWLLIEYQVKKHIPSDIATEQEQVYLPLESFQKQGHINQISDWTQANRMKLDTTKSNYMIFTRSKQLFATKLTMNGDTLGGIIVTQMSRRESCGYLVQQQLFEPVAANII